MNALENMFANPPAIVDDKGNKVVVKKSVNRIGRFAIKLNTHVERTHNPITGEVSTYIEDVQDAIDKHIAIYGDNTVNVKDVKATIANSVVEDDKQGSQNVSVLKLSSIKNALTNLISEPRPHRETSPKDETPPKDETLPQPSQPADTNKGGRKTAKV